MSELIKLNKSYKQIVGYVMFFLIIPFMVFAMGFQFSVVFWMLFIPFIILTVIIIWRRTFRLEVYQDKIVKSYLFRSKVEVYESKNVNFKFGGYKNYTLIPNVIAYSKGKLISQIEFNSFKALEKFVVKAIVDTKYTWFKPTGSGDVFDKIKHLIDKHSKKSDSLK